MARLYLRRRIAAANLFCYLVVSMLAYGFIGSPPLAHSAQDPVLVGAGDIASCDSTGDDATAKLLDTIDGTVFTVGDNAYPNGLAEDFRDCYEPTWGRHKARTRPALGNHEYYKDAGAAHFDYFQASTGRRGEGYYSYDMGAWHVVVLNSNIATDLSSPQAQWLRADLASNVTRCTVAYWHHALFSSGSHGNYPQVRDVWRILYEFGVDVVLNGHDHNYERFAPQDPDGQLDPRGIRQFIVGTGGAYRENPTSAIQPNSEILADTVGVLKLTLHTNSYDWEFIPVPGETFRDVGQAECVDGAPPPKQPVLSRLSPAAATVGGSGFTLTVNGANFVKGTTLQWNGTDLPTTLINSTQLSASIPSEAIASLGTANITVRGPSQNHPSNALSFQITPPAAVNLLVNGSFEADDNNDRQPDGWEDSSYAIRQSRVVHTGDFAMEHYATDEANYVIDQTAEDLKAGTEYDFSGWINIPSSNDVFGYELDLEIRWQTSNNEQISTSTLQKLTESTNGWHHVAARLNAPPGTTNAKVRMEVDSLNAIVFVDDFAFRPVHLPSSPGSTLSSAVELPNSATEFFTGSAPSTAAGGTVTFPPATDTASTTEPASEHATSSASKGELMVEVVLVLTIALQIIGLMFMARTFKRSLQGSV